MIPARSYKALEVTVTGIKKAAPKGNGLVVTVMRNDPSRKIDALNMSPSELVTLANNVGVEVSELGDCIIHGNYYNNELQQLYK
ncbi:MAG: hypothetical protein ABH879_06060 [archaeon]